MKISELVAEHGYGIKIWDAFTPQNPFVVDAPGVEPNTFVTSMPWFQGMGTFTIDDTKDVFELWED